MSDSGVLNGLVESWPEADGLRQCVCCIEQKSFGETPLMSARKCPKYKPDDSGLCRTFRLAYPE